MNAHSLLFASQVFIAFVRGSFNSQMFCGQLMHVNLLQILESDAFHQRSNNFSAVKSIRRPPQTLLQQQQGENLFQRDSITQMAR